MYSLHNEKGDEKDQFYDELTIDMCNWHDIIDKNKIKTNDKYPKE